MAFKLDDLIIDRIQVATAEDSHGNVLYTLTQLQEATINISAESNDVTDKDGNLVKRFWRAKTGEFTATNAFINLNILGEEAGSGKMEANVTRKITAPGIIVAKASNGATVTLANVTGTPKVYGMETNGTLGTEFQTGGTATATTFVYDDQTGVVTLPLSGDYVQYLIRYDRELTSGAVEMTNMADKFPGTIRLVLKVLCVDPCEADTLRAAYIDIPSFQVSPESEVSLSSDNQTIDFSGSLQVDYCDADKRLYSIYVVEDDEEE